MASLPVTYRFVVAESQPLSRYGLARLIETQPQFQVVRETGSGAEALAAAYQERPDCLLVADDLPDIPGLQVLAELVSYPGALQRIMLTSVPDAALLVQALHLRAKGVLSRSWSTELLLKVLSKVVLAGQYCIEREHIANVLRELQHSSDRFRLTARELQVTRLIVDGCSNKIIAESMDISEQTVKHHLSNIFDKLGVSTRLELASFAVHHGLTDSPETSPLALRRAA